MSGLPLPQARCAGGGGGGERTVGEIVEIPGAETGRLVGVGVLVVVALAVAVDEVALVAWWRRWRRSWRRRVGDVSW